MRRETRIEMERWLAAEAAGDEAGAEDAFAAMLGGLPRLSPHPGFAERVVMAVAPRRRPALARWVGRLSLAAAVALAGLTAGLIPLVRWLPIEAPRPGALVNGFARSVAAFDQWLRTGLDVWEVLARIGGAVGVAAATPEVSTAMLGSALVSAAALYTLHHLLVYERRV